MYVAEAGRSATNRDDLVVDAAGSYWQHEYDLRGLTFDEVRPAAVRVRVGGRMRMGGGNECWGWGRVGGGGRERFVAGLWGGCL
jgi:hypothetical protein